MDPTLLDTDMLSEVLKQRNALVSQRARQYIRSQGQFSFSAVTRFEIIRGYKELGATTQLARFATVCSHSLILPVTDAVFDRAADLWVFARQGGFPRGDADLLVAASAMELGYRLATGNTQHFSWIPGLQVDDWRLPGLEFFAQSSIRQSPSPTTCSRAKWGLCRWTLRAFCHRARWQGFAHRAACRAGTR